MKVLLFLSVLIALTVCLPELPKHSFDKRVLLKKDNESDISKKVFVTFKQGSFTFKKKRVKANPSPSPAMGVRSITFLSWPGGML